MRQYVYFFKHKGIKGVKIGMTESNRIKDRFSAFNTYSPTGAIILGVIATDNAHKLERKLHLKFKDKRMNGEFFDIGPSEVNLLTKHNSLKNDFLDIFYKLNFDGKINMLNLLKKYKGIFEEDNSEVEYNDFFNSEILLGVRYKKQDFVLKFNKAQKLNIKSNTITKWVKKWCAYYNYEYKDFSYNSIRYFEINNVF